MRASARLAMGAGKLQRIHHYAITGSLPAVHEATWIGLCRKSCSRSRKKVPQAQLGSNAHSYFLRHLANKFRMLVVESYMRLISTAARIDPLTTHPSGHHRSFDHPSHHHKHSPSYHQIYPHPQQHPQHHKQYLPVRPQHPA